MFVPSTRVKYRHSRCGGTSTTWRPVANLHGIRIGCLEKGDQRDRPSDLLDIRKSKTGVSRACELSRFKPATVSLPKPASSTTRVPDDMATTELTFARIFILSSAGRRRVTESEAAYRPSATIHRKFEMVGYFRGYYRPHAKNSC